MYDFIIIGGGPAGLGAAIYASRFGLKTLVLTKERYGLLATTHLVENYPSFKSISGAELMEKIDEHAQSFGAEIKDEEVIEVKKQNSTFKVKTHENEYSAKAILFATGTIKRKLDAKGEEKFMGKGVSYCATCDAAFFKDKVVGVVGGSDSAAKEALMLTEYAKKVYIIYRKQEIRAEPINKKRVEENKKIEIIPNTNVVEIKGDKVMKSVIFDNGKEFVLDGLFVEIGHMANTKLAGDIGVKLNENKEIIVNRNSETNVKGIYAAGDVINTEWKQAITAVSQGCTAAYYAYNLIKGQAK